MQHLFMCVSRNGIQISEACWTFCRILMWYSQIGLRSSEEIVRYNGSSHLYQLGISCVIPKPFKRPIGYSQGVLALQQNFPFVSMCLWELPVLIPNPHLMTYWDVSESEFSRNYSAATSEFRNSYLGIRCCILLGNSFVIPQNKLEADSKHSENSFAIVQWSVSKHFWEYVSYIVFHKQLSRTSKYYNNLKELFRAELREFYWNSLRTFCFGSVIWLQLGQPVQADENLSQPQVVR